jgi:hypothetical protein
MTSINSFKDISIIEQRIIRKLVNKAIGMGYEISVHDGEEFAVRKEIVCSVILNEIGATDETTLHFYLNGIRQGWILLIHGNDEDVVSDYSDNVHMNALTKAAGC